MGRHSIVDHPAVERSDALTSTGTHRAIGRTSRRGVAAWPIASVVLVVLLVLGWFGWNWADGVVQSRAQAQAADCQDGETSIQVAVAPSVEQPVMRAAQEWNDNRTVVHGYCVDVDVEAVPTQQVLDSLLAGSTAEMPAAWIPESSSSIEQLSNQRPGVLGSSARSVATGAGADYPFVTLAGEQVDDVQQRAAQSFRAFLVAPEQRTGFSDAGLTPATR
ncbi:hypothetical protein SacmaDRAFT_2780 [Saccharomonospora marina XMU15]|uniref:Uncharacterized protein n=1 Tax=Saccharomonospora marina XMU15 TaxID=882083 RepID=H5X3K7_9PSEU|nr:substrate-binding domain-containing protein [Saccharomonospora marina]EHR51020.1 hypothetical protein SacmaDRAFT_2780 [Saccharomonospora marina XMU15]